MKITVLYNEVTQKVNGKTEDLLADQDTVKTAKDIASELVVLGYEVELFKVDEISVSKINKTFPTDLFFNNAFGIGNAEKSEADLAGIIENTGIPFTGATQKNIILTTDKVATKNILIAAGLPTPMFQVSSGDEKLNADLRFPLFAKPMGEDCSFGITQTSVVQNENELKNKITELVESYHEGVLVEEFIEGRELNVSVVGKGDSLKVLPISEIVFGEKFPGKYRIVDFESKWNEESDYFTQSTGVCPALLDEDTKKNVENIAKQAFIVCGCRHFARIDMRLDQKNQPWILEVNANPGLGRGDGMTRSASTAGYSYEAFLDFLVQLAVK